VSYRIVSQEGRIAGLSRFRIEHLESGSAYILLGDRDRAEQDVARLQAEEAEANRALASGRDRDLCALGWHRGVFRQGLFYFSFAGGGSGHLVFWAGYHPAQWACLTLTLPDPWACLLCSARIDGRGPTTGDGRARCAHPSATQALGVEDARACPDCARASEHLSANLAAVHDEALHVEGGVQMVAVAHGRPMRALCSHVHPSPQEALCCIRSEGCRHVAHFGPSAIEFCRWYRRLYLLARSTEAGPQEEP
jgi:hypothetical protein